MIGYFFTSLAIIGAVALLLSTAGIYALISFTLARRTREIGIRTALGASPRRIITGILSRALFQIALGVAAGFVPGVLIVSLVSTESGRNGIVDGSRSAPPLRRLSSSLPRFRARCRCAARSASIPPRRCE